jgi:hypothetical protein
VLHVDQAATVRNADECRTESAEVRAAGGRSGGAGGVRSRCSGPGRPDLGAMAGQRFSRVPGDPRANWFIIGEQPRLRALFRRHLMWHATYAGTVDRRVRNAPLALGLASTQHRCLYREAPWT